MEMITSFREENRFLSNFYQCPLTVDGLIYPNAEAAFQAHKCADPADRVKYTLIKNPVVAKRMGKKEKLDIADWNARAYDVMLKIIRIKFQNPELAQKLLDTGDAHIEEGNKWHDNVWGHCICDKCQQKPGKNQLGRILMLVRDELRG